MDLGALGSYGTNGFFIIPTWLKFLYLKDSLVVESLLSLALMITVLLLCIGLNYPDNLGEQFEYGSAITLPAWDIIRAHELILEFSNCFSIGFWLKRVLEI